MITQFFPYYKTYPAIEECINDNFILNPSFEVGDNYIIDFFDKLSKYFLASKISKNYPEVIAFAYWIRKSNITRIIENYYKIPETVLVPRGVSFHIAPSNVDIMFLYSWVISFLSGNSNIIRISYNESELVNFVITSIEKVILDGNLEKISQANKIITYEHNDKISEYLSLLCDTRIIWGGDLTIAKFRLMPGRPHCKDVSFADKFSYSVIESSAYNQLTGEEKKRLGIGFFNDSLLFDQMACSSPQVLIFVGTKEDCSISSRNFKLIFDKIFEEKLYLKSFATNMDHLVNWYVAASHKKQEGSDLISDSTPTFVKIGIDEINHEYKTCGGGFFLECHISDISELTGFSSKKDQTVSYFGFGKDVLKKFIISNNSSSPCRIVPIGEALNFDFIWDGYSLFHEFVKFIRLK